jgi:hypothetical protein
MIMNGNALFDEEPEKPATPGVAALPTTLPFIWPEARVHSGGGKYSGRPPSRSQFAEATLISGVVIGLADSAIEWIGELLQSPMKRRVTLVVVVFPASPTREQHLRGLLEITKAVAESGTSLEVRLLPLRAFIGGEVERRLTLPPTVIQGVDERNGSTVMTIGSVGDAGCDAVDLGSFNVVFRPDDALRDAWRRWFQYILCRAHPLTEEVVGIPTLVPAKGDPEAAALWQSFMDACQGETLGEGKPVVDPNTGEVIEDGAGQKITAWDGGATALDPLAQMFQRVYAGGWLVTVDEATRIKPLSVPVKATLLGQQSERNVGAVKQKQSFTLQVLDDEIEKAVERCRKVTDVMDLLTFKLSQGNRWISDAAKSLMEKELLARNKSGQEVLTKALGGDVKAFVAKRKDAIRKDLNEMYQQLGQGKAVPPDKLGAVLADVEARLSTALTARITPQANYNRIGPPELTANAPPQNWNQPLSLLIQAATLFRDSIADPYFPRRVSSMAFSKDEFEKACDVFEDVMRGKGDVNRAKRELEMLEAIAESDKPSRDRCQEVWAIVSGTAASP